MVSCLTGSVFAAGTGGNAEQFWQENGDRLLSQGIFQYGERPFREGLMPALVKEQWNYINEQGEVVDLNRGRFLYVFDFFEGLAAVMDKDTMKVGYIDTTGKLVIPCQYYAYDSMGGVYVGYFHNGKATVFTDGSFAATEYGGSTVKGAQVAEINKSGSKSSARTWSSDELTRLYLIGDNGYMPDGVEEQPSSPLKIEFEDDYFLSDFGPLYSLTVTNTSSQPVQGAYSLLVYEPEAICWACTRGKAYYEKYLGMENYVHRDDVQARVFPIDLDLAAGESKTFSMRFQGICFLSDCRFIWVEYDNAAERETYLTSDALSEDVYHSGETTGPVWGYGVEDQSFLTAYPYNLTFAPLTHKDT
ncbi:WG repeat-containing protein [Pseudoflavonifractor sp. AF19-9AC]|nr:WG repeat-containing protein [Pseudoflavonifractor sp. AF19-9AC]